MGFNIIEWQNDKTPRSKIYDDIYFSSDDGLAESQTVFIDGIGAPKVWEAENQFTICELGFGTGLNFLNTVKLWLETTSEDQKLNYVATEKHALDKEDIRKIIYWEELQLVQNVFLEQYPSSTIKLFKDRVSLKLLFGDSLEMLKQEKDKVDAWYLDGFAPNRNPEMWSPELFAEIARLSNHDTVLATFTAAGFVRRGLSEAGFQMSKRAGFGRKREMLKGIYIKTKSVA